MSQMRALKTCDLTEMKSMTISMIMKNQLNIEKEMLNISDIRLEMQKIMQKHAGVFRNDKLLEEGVE